MCKEETSLSLFPYHETDLMMVISFQNMFSCCRQINVFFSVFYLNMLAKSCLVAFFYSHSLHIWFQKLR